MEIAEIRTKAKELKTEIENSLKKFRTETGIVPGVKVETKERPTNDGSFVSQVVTITINLQ